MTAPAATSADPGQPVPCALTALALAALTSTALAVIPAGQWACRHCGSAWLGTAPASELCPACADPAAPGGRYVPPLCPGADPGADWQEMGWCCHTCAALAHLGWCPNHDPADTALLAAAGLYPLTGDGDR